MKSETEPIVFKSFRTPGLGKTRRKNEEKNGSETQKVIFCSSRSYEEMELFNSALGGIDGCGFISALVSRVISEAQIYITGRCWMLSGISESSGQRVQEDERREKHTFFSVNLLKNVLPENKIVTIN